MKRRKKLKMILLFMILIIIGIIIYLSIPYSPVKTEYWKKINNVEKKQANEQGIISKNDLRVLPEAIQKYFINNGYLGIEKTSKVIFNFKNVDFSMGLNKPKLKIDYTIYDFVNNSSRFALINTKMFKIPFQGIDIYENGQGSMKGVIAKNVTLFNEKGDDMNSGALVTYLSECLMHPSLALQKNIKYKEIDKYTVEATIVDNDIKVSGIFYFNENYEMTSFQSKRFAEDTNSYENWSAVASNYKKIKGINTPTRLQAIWHYDKGDLIYFDSKSMEICYK